MIKNELSIFFLSAICLMIVSAFYSQGKSFKISDVSAMEEDFLIEEVKEVLGGEADTYVLFKYGSYVVLEDSIKAEKLESVAIRKMKTFGPVYTGSPAGDFGVLKTDSPQSWIVSSHMPEIFTYVHASELKDLNPTDYDIGCFGRCKRDLDGKEPEVIYISR